MEDLSVIVRVIEPIDRVNSIATPGKHLTGALWVCLDSRDPNQGIMREQYSLKTLEEP